MRYSRLLRKRPEKHWTGSIFVKTLLLAIIMLNLLSPTVLAETDLEMWLEFKVTAFPAPQDRAEGLAPRLDKYEDWQLGLLLTGKLTFSRDQLENIGEGERTGPGEFKPGLNQGELQVTFYSSQAREGESGPEILHLQMPGAEDHEFRLEAGEADRLALTMKLDQSMLEEAAFPDYLPLFQKSRTALLQTVSGSGPEIFLNLVHQDKGIVWLLTGRIIRFSDQPFRGGSGTVLRRLAFLHRSPHQASRVEAEVKYGDTYLVEGLWWDRQGRTWLQVELTDQVRGWFLL